MTTRTYLSRIRRWNFVSPKGRVPFDCLLDSLRLGHPKTETTLDNFLWLCFVPLGFLWYRFNEYKPTSLGDRS
jgi:hypothetical protein